MFIGPTLGPSHKPVIYSLDSDESSMIAQEQQLTEREKAFDKEYVENNTAYTLSMLSYTKPSDYIILDKNFQNRSELVPWTQKMFAELGIETAEHIQYAEPKKFPELAKKLAAEHSIDTIATIGYSYVLNSYFPVEKYLEISKIINSKTELLGLSEKYKFSIPYSVVTTLSELQQHVPEQFNFPEQALYIKLNGLGGGNNVIRVGTHQELKEALKTLPLDIDVLVQQEVKATCTHGIATYIIYPDRFELTCVRTKMTTGSTWYGNIFSPEIHLSQAQISSLDNAARAVQELGYAAEYGLLVGFDMFFDEKDIFINEINGRYLGSTPSEMLMKRLGILNQRVAVSSFDYVAEDEIEAYMKFVETHLYKKGDTQGYSMIPMSFAAYPSAEGQRIVFFVVLGDFETFAKDVKAVFSDKSFVMLDNSLQVYHYHLQNLKTYETNRSK